MPHCTMLCNAALCQAISCHAMPCHVMLCYFSCSASPSLSMTPSLCPLIHHAVLLSFCLSGCMSSNFATIYNQHHLFATAPPSFLDFSYPYLSSFFLFVFFFLNFSLQANTIFLFRYVRPVRSSAISCI